MDKTDAVTERLDGPDLDRIERQARAVGRGPYLRETLALLALARDALRAQQAPTTDEPAAWLVEYVDEDSEEMVYLDRRLADVYADQEGGEVVPLYRHPAPATDEETVDRMARALYARFAHADWEQVDGLVRNEWRAEAHRLFRVAQGGGDRG